MKYENNSLERHAYGRTRTALGEKTRVQALQELEHREDLEAAKASTACVFAIGAKSTEGLVRDLLNVRGVEYILRGEGGHRYIDFAARPNNTKRGECRIYGRPGEVKTGGTVAYGVYSDNWTVEDLLPGKAYIAFALLEQASEYSDAIDGLCDCTAIMSRSEFFALCEKASRKGLRGTFHLNKRGDISFQPTPLAKLRNMIWEGIKAGKLETLEGYLLDRA